MDEDAREPKRERVDDDDGEEMEIEDDEEPSAKDKAPGMLSFRLIAGPASDVRLQALHPLWYNSPRPGYYVRTCRSRSRTMSSRCYSNSE